MTKTGLIILFFTATKLICELLFHQILA